MAAQNHLVIFARAPRLGTGKRRLAREIGPVAALRFQRIALAHLRHRLGSDRRWRTWLAVTPDRSGPWPRRRVLRQGPGDLGQRMARALRVLPPGPAVIVGSDIPAIAPADIAAAFRALGRCDAVVGPATDGGYWLVGARRPLPRGLFANVRWSTPHALADTLANLQGRRVARLRRLEDVDDAASLARQKGWERRVRA